MARKITVVGGGASGLMAAVMAARGGAEVTVLEHKDRVGKKLLMTGNGRCNLTNVSGFEGKYFSSDEASMQKIYGALGRFGADDAMDFFRSIGVFTKEKRDGGIYPVSEQASCVLDALRSECAQLGVRTVVNADVSDVRAVKCDRLILATGGKAAPSTGSDGSGYALAKRLGHNIITPLPALVQLRCEGDFFKSVAGVRAQAGITLYIDGKKTAYEEGELQLTDYGISGIPVFQFSRLAARALHEKKKCEAEINFMTQVSEKDLDGSLAERYGGKTIEELLGGMVHKKIASLICRRHKLDARLTVFDAGEERVKAYIDELRHFKVRITSANSFDNAQVCSGGVPLGEVSDCFRSLKARNVYIVGELLDCDGICGGYNLQWAWTTGAIAGKDAANDND